MMAHDKPTRRTWWGVVLFLLLACWLGARMLNADILFVDEYWSIRNSGGDPFPLYSLGAVWERTATVDPGGMGVLYHWLLYIWGQFIGSSVYSIRAFSLLAGLLSIALLYRVGRDLFQPRIGLYAAGVLAASAFYIDYLHEARAYTLLVFFTLLAIHSYYRVMHRRGGAVWFGMLSLSLAALAYTHYVALAIGAVLGVYHLTRWQMTRRWWGIVLAMAAGGVLYLPWVDVALEVIQRGTTDTGRQASSMTAPQIVDELAQAFSNLNLALFGLLGLYAFRKPSRELLLVSVWVVVTLGLVMLINWQIPFMVHLRYVLLVFPALALLVAIGIESLANRRIPALLLLGVWVAGGLYQVAHPDFISEQFGQIYRAPAAEFHAARDVMNHRAQPDDMILFHIMPRVHVPFNYFVLGYYMDATPFRYDQIERMNNSFAASDNDYIIDVRAALADSPAVWTAVLPQVAQTQRSTVAHYVLNTEYLKCGRILPQDTILMTLFAHPDLTTRTAPAAEFTTENDQTIRVYDIERSGQAAAQFDVPLLLDFDAVPAEDTYSLGVYLLDAAGQVVAQDDLGLSVDFTKHCTQAAIDITGIEPGDYTLSALIYNWRTGDRLGALASLRTVTIE